MREPEEFDCAECGCHIVRIVAQPTMPKLCAACIAAPGWFNDPIMAKALDPMNWRRPPPHEVLP